MTSRLDAKLLYRRLDALFGGLHPGRSQRELVVSFLEDSFGKLGEDLRLRAAILYGERRDDFERLAQVGEDADQAAETLEPGLAPLQSVFRHRVYIFPDPEVEASPFRAGWLPKSAAAAVVVGRRPSRYVLAFLLADGWGREELDFALNTIRAALGSRLVDERVRGSFREAAEIQQSLLVEEAPEFSGFELACRSVPAEEVGGDFFDFMDFGSEMLGVSIGDASGHGLPAALLVRDVVTGLRMGIEKDLKVAHVFRQLNRVIHRSSLSSRFVSVFYGELEQNGTLVYVNAGHQPPILFFREQRPGQPCDLELTIGGTVIGPLPEARFRRGFARVHPGEVVLMLTDGILERRDKAGEFFGLDRVRAIVREHQGEPATAILDHLFEAALGWGAGRPWEDDATIVVVKRDNGPA
jgi:sigma-B regulation protein RsbU (phosphoserine phosphatase)